MEQLLKYSGLLIAGATLVYSVWYLINTKRMAIHTKRYNRKTPVFLAFGSLIISSVLIYSLLHNLIAQTHQYYIRMTGIIIGMTCLLVSMITYEKEQ